MADAELRSSIERAKARLDTLDYYPEPVRIAERRFSGLKMRRRAVLSEGSGKFPIPAAEVDQWRALARPGMLDDVAPQAFSGVHRGPLRAGEWVRLTDSKGRVRPEPEEPKEPAKRKPPKVTRAEGG